MKQVTFAVGVVVSLLTVACLAPRAELIEGDVASAIEKGLAEGTDTFDHSLWDEILSHYVKEGGRKLDYVSLKSDESGINRYLQSLADVDLTSLPGNEILALFANAYNAYTVKTILERVSPDGSFEIESIRDIPEVFDLTEHEVGGYILSLNNMEHNILRPYFKDPRIHFAVNCASTSCPPIPTRAFRGETVQQQLEDVTRNVLSSPDYVLVDGDDLVLTRIMDWYGEDFVSDTYNGAQKDLPSFVRKYTREKVRRWIDAHPTTPNVKFMKYDWSLNKN
jgi:hypothetical protein